MDGCGDKGRGAILLTSVFNPKHKPKLMCTLQHTNTNVSALLRLLDTEAGIRRPSNKVQDSVSPSIE